MGTNFKLLKACSFCRKRKLKCIVPRNSFKCEECTIRGQDCIFDHKVVHPRSRGMTRTNAHLHGISAQFSSKSRISPKSTLFPKNTSDVTSNFPNISSTTEESNNSLLSDLAQNSEYPVTQEESRIDLALERQKKIISSTNEENLPSDNFSSLPKLSKNRLSHLPTTTSNERRASDNTSSLDIQDSVCIDQLAMLTSIRREEIGMLSLNIYKTHVEPYTPFVLYNFFNPIESGGLDHFSKLCIQVASLSSPTNQIPLSTTDLLFEVLEEYMENDSRYIFNEMTLSFFLLLPLRIRISDKIVQKYLRMFNKFYEEKGSSLPINLLVGALTVDSFYSLLKSNWILTTNTSILTEVTNFLATLNRESFNYHFLSVVCFIYRLMMLFSNKILSFEEQRLAIWHLEYEMLLWPAKLTLELSVVEDNLLATPEAFFLHVVHNTLLTEFYMNAVKHKNKFGKMSSIFAVPGLYQFLSGMAKSNFRLNEGLVGRWSIIANCQMHTAKILLDLYNFMEFDELILSLRYYKKSSNVIDFETQDHIFSQIQSLLSKTSSYKLGDDDKEGAKVFWVFRDVRSMSLQSFIDESMEEAHQ